MKRRPILISIVALTVLAVGVGAWQYLSPPVHDDITYQNFCLPTTEDDFWELEGSPITTFGQAIESSVNHWILINGRLSNIFATFLLLTPAWLLAALEALMTAVMTSMMLYFGLGRKALHTSWICALLPLAIWKLLPWFNNMCSDAYMINYVWPSALTLCFLWAILHPDMLESRLRRWLLALAALPVGMMHEAFCIPTLAAIAVLLAFPHILPASATWPSDWRRRILPAVVAFAIGACFCIFAPSTFVRLMRYQAEDAYSTTMAEAVLTQLRNALPLFLYIAVCLLALWRRGWRQVRDEIKKQTFWIVIAVIAEAINIVLRLAYPRGMWLFDVIVIIMTLQLVGRLFPALLRPLRGLAVAAVAAQIVFFANLLPLQARIGQQITTCVDEFQRRGDGMAFVDFTLAKDLPWWSFGMVHSPADNTMFNMQMVKMLPRFKGQKNVAGLILPTSMNRVKTFTDLPPIPGSNPFRGVFPLVLSKEYIATGTTIDVVFGEAGEIVNPLKRKASRAGQGVLKVKASFIVPAFLPDTVYAIYFPEQSHSVREMTYQP